MNNTFPKLQYSSEMVNVAFSNILLHTNLTFEQVFEKLLEWTKINFPSPPLAENFAQYKVSHIEGRFKSWVASLDDLIFVCQALGISLDFSMQFPQQKNEAKVEDKPIVTSYPAIWDQDINELDLPVRATNCVRYGGSEEIHYVGQLIKLGANEVRKFVNVGETTLRHIEVGLTEKGLKFKTDTGNWQPPQP